MVLSMDILASMLAYLVSMAGVIGAMTLAAFVFFHTPQAPSPEPAPAHATALLVRPSVAKPVPPKPQARLGHEDKRAASVKREPPVTIAQDARQEPQASYAAQRRLADKERAKRIALRDRSDFEARFLHETN